MAMNLVLLISGSKPNRGIASVIFATFLNYLQITLYRVRTSSCLDEYRLRLLRILQGMYKIASITCTIMNTACYI